VAVSSKENTNEFTELIQLLRQQKGTVGFAESCTGGLISSTLCEAAGVSDIFKGAVVAYDNAVKISVLGVPAKTIESLGAVSEQVAIAMASGTKKVLSVKYAIAVTGIAGPTGGSLEKPVGTVCFAVSGPAFESSLTQHFVGDRKEIQKQSAKRAVQLLNEALK
jgi:nicotinamide-nucleotide amidase